MVAKRDPRVAVSSAYLAQARSTRRPQHRFNITTKPYQIQPFLLAPVLPGETLKNMMIQSQVWSDPLKTGMRNVGWWNEYFFFYVKHRDLAGWDQPGGLGQDLAAMMLDPGKSMAAHKASAQSWKTYAFAGGIDFTQKCLERVVEEYFRDDGEAWNVKTLDGLPLARIYGKGADDWTQKLTAAANYTDRRQSLDVDGDGDITLDEVQRAYGEWAAMHDAGLTDMDYQDYLRTYGVQTREVEASPNLHRPEDIAHLRNFTYPTNTVDPATGAPTTAVGWRVANRLDKAIMCQEPGFLVGYNVIRPKVYMRPQRGSVACSMTDVFSWLPALLHDEHEVSHKHFEKADGPLGGKLTDAGGYWIDLRDLLLHGDQFINYDPAGKVPFVDLPQADTQRRYAAQADIEAMFNAAGGKFEQDGLVSLSILGRQRERTKNVVLGRA